MEGQFQQPQIDIKTLPYAKCESCDGETFRQVFKLKEVSAVLSPVGKTGVVPVLMYVCDSCGEILWKYVPEEYH